MSFSAGQNNQSNDYRSCYDTGSPVRCRLMSAFEY